MQDGRFIEFELRCCEFEGECASFRGFDTLVAVAGYVGAAAAAAGLVIG